MILNKVELRSFRNYSSLSLDLAPGLNLFLGSNAQGKTNFLESLYLLGTAKSFRVRSELELINWNSSFASVKAYYIRDNKRTGDLEIRWAKSQEKGLERRILEDQNPLKRLSDFLGILPTVLFIPNDLSLIQQGPVWRRRYLDILLCKTSKEYFANLTKFQQILKQRNSLLRKGSANAQEFAYWDTQFAETACIITQKRKLALQKLNRAVSQLFSEISQDDTKLSLSYRSSLPSAEDREKVQEWLRSNRAEECMRGLTLIGPHRDDFEIHLNSKSLKRTGSQGQHRSAALALRLGEAKIMEEALQEQAVILLDDCFSELDFAHSSALLECLNGIGQVIVTSASSIAHLADLQKLSMRFGESMRWSSYKVESGTIKANDSI